MQLHFAILIILCLVVRQTNVQQLPEEEASAVTDSVAASPAANENETLQYSDNMYRDYYLTIYILSVSLEIIALVGNIFVMVVFIHTPSLQTSTNIFVLNLSICDMLSSLTALFFMTSTYTQAGLRFTSRSKYGCLLCLAALVTSLSSSIYNILLLSIERFIAIYFAMRYFSIVTERRAKLCCVIQWTLVVTLNSLPILGLNVWEQDKPCFPFNAYHKAYIMMYLFSVYASIVFSFYTLLSHY